MKIPFTKKNISLSVGKNSYTDWALIFALNILFIAGFIYAGVYVYKDSGAADPATAFNSNTTSRKDELSVTDYSNLVRSFEEKQATAALVKSGGITMPSPFAQ